MEKLSYKTLQDMGYKGYLVPRDAPEKVLQFGEGNFLRSFVDRYFDYANEKTGWNGKICILQPIDDAAHDYGFIKGLNAQDCLYTVLERGKLDGKTYDDARLVSSVSRCLNPFRAEDLEELKKVATSDDLELVVSNTTEAGIAYDPSCKAEDAWPSSFPAKLAKTLRFRFDAGKGGLTILSCELIDHNGAELEKIVKRYASDWGWEKEFTDWLDKECLFCTTLVDTIVPGRIRDPKEAAKVAERLGYEDPFLAVREPFQMWGIEGDDALAAKLPFIQSKEPGVFVTPDVTPYKKRKVRILNGAHTGFVPGAWLAGFNIVRDCMHDDTIRGFMNMMLEHEVIPTLSKELDRADLEAFAKAVENRFDNPFIDHQLLSICLNSTSKWRARDLPSLLDYVEQEGKLPKCLTMSLAALLAFYTTGTEGLADDGLHLKRADGTEYVAQDDASALSFFAERKDAPADRLVDDTLSNTEMWGQDLHEVKGLRDAVVADLELIRREGTKAAFASCLK